MIEIKIIRIVSDEGVMKTCFVENDRLVFETERTYLDKHNEAVAFEMGLSFGLGFSNPNFTMPRIDMTQEEFDALKLGEASWGCLGGPRTKRKKTT